VKTQLSIPIEQILMSSKSPKQFIKQKIKSFFKNDKKIYKRLKMESIEFSYYEDTSVYYNIVYTGDPIAMRCMSKILHFWGRCSSSQELGKL